MRRFCLSALLLTLAAPAAFPNDVATEAIPMAMRERVEDAIQSVYPTLVRIHVVANTFREGREMKFEASGSGAIITKEGHVITNHHVAGHAKRLVCTLSNREQVDAELIGSDAATDIAVIKLLPEKPMDYPVAEFGDSSQVKVGDYVMAMGSPLSLSQSVTLGIVSNTEMVMPRRMFGRLEQDGEDVGALVRWIAHDAQIYGGNSGGPLVNLDGKIVGINEISVGLGGAIPGNLARAIADEIMVRGEVRRAWLGVAVHPLLRYSGREEGLLIGDTIEGGPAAKAGLQSGDILLSVNGEKTTVRFEEQLPEFNQMAAALPIGEPAEVTVLRDGEVKSFTITPIEREDMLPDQKEFKQWGVTVRDISFVLAKEMKRDSQDGVLVTSVRPGGPAGEAKPGLDRNDIIVKVNDEEIKNVADLRRVTDQITAGAEEPVSALTTFERKAATHVTVVDVGISELNDPGLEVKKAWLPVETQVITRDIASQMSENGDLRGFRVTQVYKGTTADEAGLEVGDLIVAVDGTPLTASAPEHYEELPALVRNYRVGTEAELDIIRDGERKTIPVELVLAPKLQREMKKYRDENFEFTVRDITFFDRADERWEQEQRGVLVEEVRPGGWASLGLLNVGDLIVEVDGKKSTDVETLENIMDGIAEDQPKSVVFKVIRGIYNTFIEIVPDWEDNS